MGFEPTTTEFRLDALTDSWAQLALKVNLVQPLKFYLHVHHWRIPRSSHKKLAWVGFEPTITEFRSDALTDWAIRPWVQLALRANVVQPLQFYLSVQCSHFISAITFVNRHIRFKRNLTQVITLAAELLIHMVFTTEELQEVVIESWTEWNLNLRPLNSVQTL